VVRWVVLLRVLRVVVLRVWERCLRRALLSSVLVLALRLGLLRVVLLLERFLLMCLRVGFRVG